MRSDPHDPTKQRDPTRVLLLVITAIEVIAAPLAVRLGVWAYDGLLRLTAATTVFSAMDTFFAASAWIMALMLPVFLALALVAQWGLFLVQRYRAAVWAALIPLLSLMALPFWGLSLLFENLV